MFLRYLYCYRVLTVLTLLCLSRVLLGYYHPSIIYAKDLGHYLPLVSLTYKYIPVIGCIRSFGSNLFHSYFPSPLSEMLLGMTLGIDDLFLVPSFKDALIATGTIHIMVVSGFNISLIYTVLYKLIGSKYSFIPVLLCSIMTLFYVFTTGAEPPVIRAWIFHFLFSLYVYRGRSVSAFLLLYLTAICMLIAVPSYFTDLSFILSFLSTLGLVCISPLLKLLIKGDSVWHEGLVCSLACQLATTPVISYMFGRVSLYSLPMNVIIAPIIPLVTLLGMLYMLLGYLFPAILPPLTTLLYVVMHFMYLSISYISALPYSSVEFFVDQKGLLLCYILLLTPLWFLRRLRTS